MRSKTSLTPARRTRRLTGRRTRRRPAIAASGLNVGVADTTVDTADLQQAAGRLETGIGHLPDALLPDVTDNVTDLVTAANQEVASLRGSLDAAIAAEAQRQAEEKARQE